MEALGKGETEDTLQMQDKDLGALCCCKDEVYRLSWHLQCLQKEHDSQLGSGLARVPTALKNLARAEGVSISSSLFNLLNKICGAFSQEPLLKRLLHSHFNPMEILITTEVAPSHAAARHNSVVLSLC